MSGYQPEEGHALQFDPSQVVDPSCSIYAWDQMLSLHLNDKTGEDDLNPIEKACDPKQEEYYQLFRWIVDRFLFYADRVGENLRALRLVVMTRRCAALVEICMQLANECRENPGAEKPLFLDGIDLDRLLKIDAECCITDAAALSCVPDWLEQYQSYGFFPLTVVLDDLMLHGRACNTFLHQIEDELIELCPWESSQRYKESLLRDFVMSVYIEVYARSTRSLLLYANYHDHFRAARKYSLAQCRRLSYKVALAVASSAVNNISSEWGLVGLASGLLSLPDSMEGFFHLQTKLGEKQGTAEKRDTANNERETDHLNEQKIDHFLFFFPNRTFPTAIGSLRLKYSATTGQPMLMPCFILADASFDRYLYTAKVLLENLKETECGAFLQDCVVSSAQAGIRCFSQQLASAVNLVLSKLLYENFFAQSSINRAYFRPNQLQLARAFCVGRNRIEHMYHEAISPEDAQPILQIALHTLLKDAEPLWHEEVVSSVPPCSGKEAYRSVLDAVADLGLASEKHAYQLYKQSSPYTGSQLSHMERQISVRELFRNMKSRCKERYNKSADYALMTAYLLHMVDYGMAGFKWGLPTDSTMPIRTETSAGEPSLFLRPGVYANYLRILAELQHKCSLNHTPVRQEIDWFVARMGIRDGRDRERFSQELTDFVEDLNQSGQNASDWFFPVPFSVVSLGSIRNKKLNDDVSVRTKKDEDMIDDFVSKIRDKNAKFYQQQTVAQINRVLAYHLGV